MLINIILFSPLVGSLLSSLFVLNKKCILAAIIPIVSICISLITTLILMPNIVDNNVATTTLLQWMNVHSFNITMGLIIDGINMIMIMVVLIVSLLVHIYSIGYMNKDENFNKFFCFLSAFVFSMLFLIMSDNFIGLFIGWEGVGLCSWMLIGFWYNKNSACYAANEAFIINRIADLGMLIGIFLIYNTFGSLQYNTVFNALEDNYLLSNGNILYNQVLAIGICLFIGAMGKSAQFPFHSWLGNAMEGPTPVSALIHAATMVTAGVYLVIRAHPIYNIVYEVGNFIAYLGAFVALFAASMAIVNNDLKRIIAFSTLSQLGYMFVAAGLGFYSIALFHLTTHAFFKSLLFLCAGNIMHSINETNIKKMGALNKPLKYSVILMSIASLALSGIYPFAGFFSKDKILESSFYNESCIIWITLLITAFLTGFYSFRLIMLVFFGSEQHKQNNPHEASKIMILSMLPLAIFTIIIGFFENNFFNYINNYLESKTIQLSSSSITILIIISLMFSISGILAAIIIYAKSYKIINANNFIYKLLYKEYYISEFHNKVVIKYYKKFARFLWNDIDIKIIDFIVDLIGKILIANSKILKTIQNGNLNSYLIIMICGVFILLFVLLII